MFLYSFPVSIQTLPIPMAWSCKKYHIDDICIMSSTRHSCTTYFNIEPSQLLHMPHICLSITINLLLIILLQGLLPARGNIISRIKGSCICLKLTYIPTVIVKMKSAILCNFFYNLYGNSLRSIGT